MKQIASVLLGILLTLSVIPVCSAAPAADAPLLDGATLVAFGDSLTAFSTWPQTIAEELNLLTVNSGIGGNTSSQGAARFERDVLAHNPDFVIMCFATNDFYLADGTNPRVDTETYKANLQYFIDEINAIGATPILMTPPFVSEEAQGGSSLYPEGSVNAALDQYVNAMREVASAGGTHLIDIHAVCDSGNYNINTFLISDGLHLSELGNQVYVDTIVEYMTANFNQDPSAPRVVQPTAPEPKDGTWTKSIVPFELDEWIILDTDAAYGIENADGTISFANTNGLWPEINYSPVISDAVKVSVANSYLTVDLELAAATKIVLYFNGPTPIRPYASTYLTLTDALSNAIPELGTSGVDVLGGQDIRCTLPLKDFVPEEYIAEDGTVIFSGLTIHAIGTAHKTVTVNELSVTSVDSSSPAPAPTYTDVDNLLPTAADQITQAEGIVDYTINADGSLTIARSADSAVAWPSVKTVCGRTIDLHETPYLHLKVTGGNGYANGHLYYTDAYGVSKTVQLSKLIDGSQNDFPAGTDIYVSLADCIQSGGTITLDSCTLSVYGVVDDSVTWATLSTAKALPAEDNDCLVGDFNADTKIDTADARAILSLIARSTVFTDEQIALGDVNGDGRLSTSDVRAILSAIVAQ